MRLLIFLLACSHQALPQNDPPDGSTVMSDLSSGCPSGQLMCFHGCGSDYFELANCVQGKWTCPNGTIDPSTCPANTCWGPPAPGEVCGPNGWECHPEVNHAYDFCPAFMCPECTGFSGPTDVNGCHCQCANNQVACERRDGGA
jgi:hypothetical protein